jgi:hypothetical protein
VFASSDAARAPRRQDDDWTGVVVAVIVIAIFIALVT